MILAPAAPVSAPMPADLLPLIKAMDEGQLAELDALLLDFEPVPWVPQPGPQQWAAESQADIIFYGGAAGGGKTDLLCGLPLTKHMVSIIFRRQSAQLTGIEERLTGILGTRKGYNSSSGLWRIPGGKRLELGGVNEVADWMKYQGRDHDYIGFDEICHFTEFQFRILIGWLRTDAPGQRCRVMCAGNPPTDPSGEWVKRFWGPWLDPAHSNPAKPGELRWYITDEKGEDEERAGPDDGRVVKIGKSEYVPPMSRTFIPSSVDDNLFYVVTGYKRQLMALPEPLRSQMLRGDFSAGANDPVWQLIPTEWIKAAQARWKARENKGPMTSLGLDPSRGGKDRTGAARRHDTWFDELLSVPGAIITDGPAAAAFVAPLVRNGACIAVDAIGIGSSALDFIKAMGMLVLGVVASQGSGYTDKQGNFRMRNVRAEMYWRMREALDPVAEPKIALPPDPELLGDLASVRYKVVLMGQTACIQVLSKDDIREQLGRSPDKGDAVAQTFLDLPAPGSHLIAGPNGHGEDEYDFPDWRL